MASKVLWICAIIVALVFLLLPGCKIEVTAPEGGRVVTRSGAFTCESGSTCVIDVVDVFFDETFEAEPASGYLFSNWRKRDRGLCGDRKEPCHLYTTTFPGTLLMQFLESDEVFYLEPLFYRTELSGKYALRPQRESQIQCGNEPAFYKLPNPFSINVKHFDEHLLSDFIVGNEVPGAELVHKGMTVSEVDFRNFTQRALFSHPVSGYIDYYLFFNPHSSSKVGFSGDYFAETVERVSGRICSSYTYFFSEKSSDSIPNSGFPNAPNVAGSYHLDIEEADIVCSDGTAGVGPGVTANMEVTQSVNLISFNNPARALAEARTDPSSQSQYLVGGTINKSGQFVANGFARVYYDSHVQEWTIIKGNFETGTIHGTIKILHIPGELDGTCTEIHSFTGYRTD